MGEDDLGNPSGTLQCVSVSFGYFAVIQLSVYKFKEGCVFLGVGA